jgi:acetylornithine/succinyldiaminopimelate/putrescine aminotransferase
MLDCVQGLFHRKNLFNLTAGDLHLFSPLLPKEVQVVDTGASAAPQRSRISFASPYEVLAAKNATLRLRAPSGHIFSFTDLTSAHGAVNFGHLNPEIDPCNGLATDVAPGFYPPSAAVHAKWLCRELKLGTHSVVYQVGSSSAVIAAIRMAQAARPGKILAIDGSVHAGLGSLLRAGPAGSEDGASIAVGSEFSAWDDISCLIYEPIQGACGYVPLPLPWLRGLSQAAQARGAVVIADEMSSGFYRFGKLSLAASEFLRPDIYLFGNSMTNGLYPATAVVYPEEMSAESLAQQMWAEPFETAALGYQAAEAVAHYIDSNDIEAEMVRINGILGEAGERLAANARLGAFHLAGPTLSLEVRDQRGAELAAACQARGVLLGEGRDGRRVMIAPPLTISSDQLTNAMYVLELVAGEL